MNRRRAELPTLSQRCWNSVTQIQLNIKSSYVITNKIKKKNLESETLHSNQQKVLHENTVSKRSVMN